MYQMLRPYVLAYFIAVFVAIFLSFGDMAIILEDEELLGAFKRSIKLTAGFGHWLHVLLSFVAAQILFIGGYIGFGMFLDAFFDPWSRTYKAIVFLLPWMAMIVSFAMAASIKYVLFRSLIARNLHRGNFKELMVEDD